MKNLINKLNQKMKEEGDIWQITSVKSDKMVSIEASKLSEMIVDLVFNPELQDKIQQAHIAIEAEEQFMQDNTDKEDWFLPCYSSEDRVKEFLSIYRDFKAEQLKDLEDDDIPF